MLSKKYFWIGMAAALLALVMGVTVWRINQIAIERDLPSPAWYWMTKYDIEKVTEQSCRHDGECETPEEYLTQSRCPFTSLCIKDRCTVICPKFKNQPRRQYLPDTKPFEIRVEPKDQSKDAAQASSLPPLPKGYGFTTYDIAKVTELSCTQHAECETPMDYLVRSSCPFTSLCLENRCTVVCPHPEP